MVSSAGASTSSMDAHAWRELAHLEKKYTVTIGTIRIARTNAGACLAEVLRLVFTSRLQ